MSSVGKDGLHQEWPNRECANWLNNSWIDNYHNSVTKNKRKVPIYLEWISYQSQRTCFQRNIIGDVHDFGSIFHSRLFVTQLVKLWEQVLDVVQMNRILVSHSWHFVENVECMLETVHVGDSIVRLVPGELGQKQCVMNIRIRIELDHMMLLDLGQLNGTMS